MPHLEKYDYSQLVPGQYYTIVHSKEGLRTVTAPAGPVPEGEINKYITRFTGRFIELNVGRSYSYPDGLPSGPGGLTAGKQVAVFDDVEIISDPPASRFTFDLYIVKPNRTLSIIEFNMPHMQATGFQQHLMKDKVDSGFRRIIESKQYRIAFSTGTWQFGEKINKPLHSWAVRNIAFGESLPTESPTEQRTEALRKAALNDDLIRASISGYLDVPTPNPPRALLAMQKANNDAIRQGTYRPMSAAMPHYHAAPAAMAAMPHYPAAQAAMAAMSHYPAAPAAMAAMAHSPSSSLAAKAARLSRSRSNSDSDMYGGYGRSKQNKTKKSNQKQNKGTRKA